MVIFLSILKIAGIVLFVLACVLAVILLVPVFYEFEGNIDEARYTVHVSWLFRIVRFRFQFHEKAEAVLRILFLRFDFTDPAEREKRRKKKARREARKREKDARKHKKKRDRRIKSRIKKRDKAHAEINLDTEAAEIKPDIKGNKTEPDVKKAEIKSKSDAGENEAEPDSKRTDIHSKPDAEGNESRTEGAGASVEEKSSGEKEEKDSVAAKILNALNLLRFLHDNQIIGMIWPKLQIFLIRIRPRKLKGEIQFGFDDPASTGQVLGGIAMIPFLYQTDLRIEPDFEAEKTYVSGYVYTKGHILCIHLIILVIRMLLDKNIRSFLGSMRKKK